VADAGFTFPVETFRALERRVALYSEASMEAFGVARDVLYTEMMKRAGADPRWVGVADFIESWDENDRYVIGVTNNQMVSQAFAAEYGTEDYPPAPLFRTMDEAVRMASIRSSAHLISRIGVGGQI
jgi:hypothetical protein